MKKQVIFNIMDKLEDEKKELRYFLRRSNKTTNSQRATWKGRAEAYEKAIQICLKEADIIDLRPVTEKYL